MALLDTGVDFTHPFIRDRLLDEALRHLLDPERRGIALARTPTSRPGSSGTARRWPG